MEGRMRKCRQTSPERAKVWRETSPKHKNRRVPVVYYLCRNRHLEHPHFIEVPLSSPEGLYLRDVVNRLNILRGRGMAALYSWSCKRSYKSGFVWHDLSEDDLILPAHGHEYVLKGSELLDESHSDRLLPCSTTKLQNPKQMQAPSSSTSPEASSPVSSMDEKETKSPREDELASQHQPSGSSSMSPSSGIGKNPLWSGPMSLTEYKVYKGDGAADAATQTEEHIGPKGQVTCVRGVSTDDGSSEIERSENHQFEVQHGTVNQELCREEISPPPCSSSNSSSSRKTETLESLIRADAKRMHDLRVREEEDSPVPSNAKLKASDVLMQLISCGSISVKDHSFGFIPSYRTRFSHSKFPPSLYSTSVVLSDFDCMSDNPRLMSMRMEDKEYFSGSLVESKTQKEDGGEGLGGLKRSSSYHADRGCNAPDSTGTKEEADSARSKCILRSIRASLTKQPKGEDMRSPLSERAERPRKSSSSLEAQGADGSRPTTSLNLSKSNEPSKRITEPSSGKRPSQRLDSFRDKERVIQIEESLLQELGL